MNNAEYTLNEAMRLNADLQRIRELPLAERKENAQTLAAILCESPEQFIQSVEWLIEGCYGKGAYDRARDTIGNKRMNRRANLFMLTAALEYSVPDREACSVWNSLSKDAQATINAAIDKTIEEAS